MYCDFLLPFRCKMSQNDEKLPGIVPYAILRRGIVEHVAMRPDFGPPCPCRVAGVRKIGILRYAWRPGGCDKGAQQESVRIRAKAIRCQIRSIRS